MAADVPDFSEQLAQGRSAEIEIEASELPALSSELSALYEIAQAAGQITDVYQLLKRVLEIVTNLDPFNQMSRGGIFLVEDGELKLLAYIGDCSQEFLDIHEGLLVGDCLCGQTAESGEVLISLDSRHEHRHSIAYPEMVPHGHVNVPLKAKGQTVGVLYLHFPAGVEIEERQVKLLQIIGSQVGLAIENVRLNHSEADSRDKIQSYVDRLAVLLDIGLSLNQESNHAKLLPLVLESAAKLSGAGVGIVAQINGGVTGRVVASFQAPWCQQSFFLKEGSVIISQRYLERLSQGLKRHAFIVSDLGSLGWVPDAYLSPKTILVGLLSDEPGHIGGYFMLGHKEGGADFSAEDEELISLLAAQSSVALTSAKNFENERLVAETLQSGLLPPAPQHPGVEVGLVYRSADPVGKIGGDYYDFIELDGGRLAVVVGDVCGKGLETAAYTAMIKYTLRANLEEGKEPGECLTRLNRHVYKHISVEKFITMCLLILDTKQESAIFASAGHMLPIVCRSGCQAEPLAAEVETPLGVLAGQRYSSWQTSLKDICALLIYTDGLSEARNAKGQLLGETGLIAALPQKCELNAQEVAERIVQVAVDFTGGQLRDDIALTVIKLRGHKPTA